MRFQFRNVLILCVLALVGRSAAANSAATRSQSPRRVTITLLSTTDIHGHIEPWDYYANKPADLGLAKIATLIKQARAQAPHALLLDCGDTTQGTPLAFYFAEKDLAKPNPAIAAFDLLHYDAMAVGNHEFNFGEKEMWKAKSESHFPWLAANVKQTYTSGVPHFGSYIIKDVEGVRVGVVGFVTPGIPRWEIPAHYRGYTFEPIVDSARRVIPEVRRKVDLLVVIMHSGLDRNPETGTIYPDQIEGENAAWELANDVPGIDVIFYGHTHREMSQLFVHGVLMAQARNWGQSLARAEVEMSRNAAGHWSVAAKHSETIPVTPSIAPDPAIMKLAEPYQEATQKYLDTPIATLSKELTGRYARYQDDPLVDLIHRVQLQAGHADVSMATMFYPGATLPAGPVTVRQVAALYVYDNTLYVVRMTGAQLKDALEHAASFFPSWPVAQGERIRLPGYNADCAEGVSYEIDLTRPVGDRIVHLAFHGGPLDPNRILRVAINNYRYTGGGRYSVYQGLPVVYRSPVEIRDLMIDYLTRTKTIPSTADGNWKIVPAAAVAAIEKAADQDTADRSR
ncbi:MAG TPA: 5'-nucleotidase C-terminal domain-containing protein [Candidatus Acidoferrum sp.]|nr:5'-nucleotidase C-terminal domain-containing protein [Candidatus Acidoferrum sp.]